MVWCNKKKELVFTYSHYFIPSLKGVFNMKSNKFNFPINFVKENLIFNNKVCYAGFKLNGFEYSSCNNSEKIRILDSLTELINYQL